jgi:Protein of unknown function (DUF1573)
MRLRPLHFVVCQLLLAVAVRAELKWDKPIQEFQRTPSDGSVEARYTFHNTGQTPVTIKGLRPSCGCTTARLDKKTYAPGEQGEILARFSIGGRTGLHRVIVKVITDENLKDPAVLDLRVNIHDPVTIAPALVYWKTGEAPATKTAQVNAEAAQPVHVKSVTSSNPRLIATLQTVKPGAQYIVSVAPADTAQKESAEISVQTDFPPDSPKTYTIHARIK